MLSVERVRKVVQVVDKELFTPYGLRSLSPKDPSYRGRYDGGPAERDSTYHQGTVWPWLLGPFITAYLKVSTNHKKALAQTSEWLSQMEEHLKAAGLGQISEIFDGDAPHLPRGCFAQAWSLAEILRAAMEDVYVWAEPAKPARIGL